MERHCIRCKHFRIKDETSGRCRVDAGDRGLGSGDWPVVGHGHSCDRWVDAGQRYFIRRGWLRNRATVAPEQG